MNEREEAADELEGHIECEMNVHVVKVRTKTVHDEWQNEEVDAKRAQVDLDDVVLFETELMLEAVVML